jgi:hypothetical protein
MRRQWYGKLPGKMRTIERGSRHAAERRRRERAQRRGSFEGSTAHPAQETVERETAALK